MVLACYCVWEPSPSPRQHLSITRGLASSLTHSTPYSSWKTRFVFNIQQIFILENSICLTYSADIHPGKLDLSLISKPNCPTVGNSDIFTILILESPICVRVHIHSRKLNSSLMFNLCDNKYRLLCTNLHQSKIDQN